MKKYETPEVFELGKAEELTLGTCSCDPDCCGGKKGSSEIISIDDLD